MFFYMMDKKIKILLVFLVLLLVLAVVYFMLPEEGVQEEENSGITVVEKDTDVEPEEEEVIGEVETDYVVDERDKQDNSIKTYKVKVKEIIDKGTTMNYIVDVGVGDAVQESQIEINEGTVFHDSIRDLNGDISLVKEGMDVLFIGRGTPHVKDMVADVIVVGDLKGYKHAKIKEVLKDVDLGGFIWNLGVNSEYLEVPRQLEIRNADTGAIYQNNSLIGAGSIILFKRLPEFTQESFGLLYKPEKIILLRVED